MPARHAGLGAGDALDEPHTFQHRGQLAQVGCAQFGQQVPAAVGVVQPGHARLAQQGADDGACLIAVHRDAHPGRDALGFGIGPQKHGFNTSCRSTSFS